MDFFNTTYVNQCLVYIEQEKCQGKLDLLSYLPFLFTLVFNIVIGHILMLNIALFIFIVQNMLGESEAHFFHMILGTGTTQSYNVQVVTDTCNALELYIYFR